MGQLARIIGVGLVTTFVVTATIAGIALPRTSEAANYDFVVRGYVDTVNVSANKIAVTGITATTSAAVKDTQSKRVDYSLSGAKVYKWENGAKAARNINHIRAGDEVVLKGTKTGSVFAASSATINDTSFTIVGRAVYGGTKASDKYITLLIGRSSWKHAAYHNTEQKMYWTSNTVCKRLGSTLDCEKIQDQNQGMKVRGKFNPANQRFEITHAWDKYPI